MRKEIVCMASHNARDLLLNHHYAKRTVGARFCFGVFLGIDLRGAILYSVPASYTLCKGVCGEGMKSHVLELSRLVLLDNEKNEASWVIGSTLKLIGDSIVVSYADPTAGHVGTVYQATNWIYTGQGNAEPAWIHPKTGEVVSNTRRHIDRKAEAFGLNWRDLIKSPRPGKHRYVTFTGTKGFKKHARRELRYGRKAYPKAWE